MNAARESHAAAVIVPYGDDPLAWVARDVFDRHAGLLPDLTSVLILLPDLHAAPRLRGELQQRAHARGHGALLGPRMEALSDWLDRCTTLAKPVGSAHARELMLVEALAQRPDLYGSGTPWRLCDSLIELFDLMTSHRVALPAGLDEFTAALARAYEVHGPVPQPLGREARLVHTLWRAWHEQMDAEGRVDRNAARLLAFAADLASAPEREFRYLVGFDVLAPPAIEWCRALLQRERALLVLHGRAGSRGYHPDAAPGALAAAVGVGDAAPATASSASAALDAAYDRGDLPLAQRAAMFAHRFPDSPLRQGLRVALTDDGEHEALAVQVQVRRWLLAGKRRIGIVTEDRKLARRIRALLERAGLELQDAAGWALSTTSAAAALERWLQAIEEDFAHQPLLDLLKSPFACTPEDRDAHMQIVFRLEQDIILHENIARGLDRYRRQLGYRRERLPHWAHDTAERIGALLDHVEHAAAPLRALLRGEAHDPAKMLEALEQSIVRLGMHAGFSADAAGLRILEELARMRAGLEDRRLRMNWVEFRSWLGRALERHNFKPYAGTGPLRLMSLGQTALARFDALIVAAADAAHLPGPAAATPFFNDAVRRELGLPTRTDALALELHRFRRLLECAPEVVLTVRREQDGEPILPSPWLETLCAFHTAAYGDDLHDEELPAMARDPAAHVVAVDTVERPPPTRRPAPAARAELLPRALSTSAHQRLIDCPYQFFAADCLGLKPREEITTALEKSDYGERVHRCLQAFHGGYRGFPGPFAGALDRNSRAAAIALLQGISEAVFAQDLEDNFMHRGWLRRWQELIPLYIDWEIERRAHWTPAMSEHAGTREIGTGMQLTGRLDRVDSSAAGLGIVDYKTGAVPHPRDVERGEAVQLPSYALLLDEVARVEYLELERSKVASRAQLEGERLSTLSAQVRERLTALLERMQNGDALPAWGDALTCARCTMDGVCRRGGWVEPDAQN